MHFGWEIWIVSGAVAALVVGLLARRTRLLTGNADAIVGKRVKVLHAVGEKQEGVVLLTGEHWKAISLAGEIAPGAEAQIVQRDGLLLLVIPFER